MLDIEGQLSMPSASVEWDVYAPAPFLKLCATPQSYVFGTDSMSLRSREYFAFMPCHTFGLITGNTDDFVHLNGISPHP